MEFIPETSGERLDKFLTSRLVKFSRSKIQRLIKDGSIKINGTVPAKTGIFLKAGDTVNVVEEKLFEEEFRIEPESDIPLDIIYEDKDIVVINKQPDLMVHPTLSKRTHTLANALVARYPKIIGVGESPFRPGIVHRIDKDTSGLIIVAKNQKAFMFVKEQFINHTVKKTYLALVEGTPKEKEMTISFRIRPSRTNRFKKVAIMKVGTVSGKKSVRTAETFYKVKERLGKFSLIEAFPKTGRTHQIRVHFAAIGCPIAGDEMYGAKSKIALPGGGQVKRQMLHAEAIEFIAPNGKKLSLKAKIPEDMGGVIRELRIENKE